MSRFRQFLENRAPGETIVFCPKNCQKIFNGSAIPPGVNKVSEIIVTLQTIFSYNYSIWKMTLKLNI